jgi:hypothetical protein
VEVSQITLLSQIQKQTDPNKAWKIYSDNSIFDTDTVKIQYMSRRASRKWSLSVNVTA